MTEKPILISVLDIGLISLIGRIGLIGNAFGIFLSVRDKKSLPTVGG